MRRLLFAALAVLCTETSEGTTICTTPDAPCEQWIGLVGWRQHTPMGVVSRLVELEDRRDQCRK